MAIIIHNLTEKVHQDERGWMSNLAEYALEKGYAIQNIHVGSIEPKQIRGNHFHKKQREWIFVFGGAGTFFWKENGEIRKQEIRSGEIYLFEVEPETSHAIINNYDKPIYLCAFTDTKYDFQNPDTVQDKICQ